ncbi:D-alanyl-D-alanine carboxypeptidase family protein [Streptomyces chattanoogensis]|uniref:D-alanyl-D-alanine carboxypeptidase family protein n=1 Tax=Streptomyces chattanoogensis TaxID=66876 RepID=UPI00099B524B|nr:serine hydrolase [Streptomyces chattanoogensis]
MAIDAPYSRKAAALAGLALAGTFLTSIPATAHSAAGGATAAGAAGARPAAPGPGVQVGAAPGVPDVPDWLSAKSWMVSDADTGDVLAAKAPHRRLPPASTLKTLFAVTVLPKFPAGSVRQVSAADLEGVGDGSSLVGVEEGGRYRVADLWRGVFLRSGNDAVHVLASMNGGWDDTAQEMQETARKLGARDTTVKSPDGYDTPGQVSSAYDLTVFGRAGLADPDFARYCATARARFPTSDGFTQIENTNRMLAGSHGLTPYPGIIGVKNGYTTHAGNTLVAAARRNGRTLLVTVMNPRSGENNAVYKEAGALLDWGFDSAGLARPIDTLRTVVRTPSEDRSGDRAKARPLTTDPVTARPEPHGSSRTSAAAGWAGGVGAVVLALAGALAWWRHGRRRGRPPEGEV